MGGGTCNSYQTSQSTILSAEYFSVPHQIGLRLLGSGLIELNQLVETSFKKLFIKIGVRIEIFQ